jgi:hypothetical protein
MLVEGGIVLRLAEIADADEIRAVMHAEGKIWDDAKIMDNIDRLYVLTYGKRILGVLCGTVTKGKETIAWVVVHPGYPENSIRAAMLQGLWGVRAASRLKTGGSSKGKVSRLGAGLPVVPPTLSSGV